MKKVSFLKIFIFSISFLVLSYSHAQEKQKKIVVTIYADSSYPPYSYEKDGKIAGIYADLMSKVFEHFDDRYLIQIKPSEWNHAIDAVQKGEVFAVYPPYKVLDGRPWMRYSAALLKENIAVFCRSNKKNWPDSFENTKIAINHGFTYPAFVSKIFQKYHMRVFALKGNTEALAYYHRGKVDCYLNDRVAVFYTNKLLKYPPIPSHQEKVVLLEDETYLGYSKDFIEKFNFGPDFINKFNMKLDQLEKSGIIDEIVNRYISSF